MNESFLGILEIVRLYIENGANINARNEKGNTALMYAIDSGNLELKWKLVKGNESNPNSLFI